MGKRSSCHQTVLAEKWISGQVIMLYIASAGVKRFEQGNFGDNQTVPGSPQTIWEYVHYGHKKCPLKDKKSSIK